MLNAISINTIAISRRTMQAPTASPSRTAARTPLGACTWVSGRPPRTWGCVGDRPGCACLLRLTLPRAGRRGRCRTTSCTEPRRRRCRSRPTPPSPSSPPWSGSRPNSVGMAHACSMASLLSSLHCSDWTPPVGVGLRFLHPRALKSSSSTCERLKPPAGVNSSGITVEAFGQSGPQPDHMPSSPAFSGSSTIEVVLTGLDRVRLHGDAGLLQRRDDRLPPPCPRSGVCE